MSKETGANDELVFNIGETVNGFKLVKKIDEGGFGQVYQVTKDDRTFYAMKLESNSQEGGSAIKLEINVLKQLPQDSVFPKMVCGGRKTRYHYLVLELLGDNLKMLKAKSPNTEVLSDGTWSRIGIQCLFALKTMHDSGFVHRDVKPSNFAVGINAGNEIRSRRVLLFDFGLARKFIKKETVSKGLGKTPSLAKSKLKGSKKKGQSVPPSAKCVQKNVAKDVQDRFLRGPQAGQGSNRTIEEKTDTVYGFRIARPHTDFRGTHQYASPNAHSQIELGRQDDVWSLMYMIAEMFVELPWTSNDDIPVEELKGQSSLLRLYTDDKNPGRLTTEMEQKLNEIDKMLKEKNYYQHPDYEMVHTFLKLVMTKSGVNWDSPYDWETLYKGEELARIVKNKKQKDCLWEKPGDFFKIDKWENLKMPSLSPTPSVKQCPSSQKPFSWNGKRPEPRRGAMSKEDSAAAEDGPSTPAQRSLKKEPSAINQASKKSYEKK